MVHSDRIESIQNKCPRIAAYSSGEGRRFASSLERCHHFKVVSLEMRRKQPITFTSIAHSMFDFPKLLKLQLIYTPDSFCEIDESYRYTLQTYLYKTICHIITLKLVCVAYIKSCYWNTTPTVWIY
jgi:hypothetical protein